MRKVVLSGLALYCVVAGLGLFLRPDVSGFLLVSWLAGFVFLVFALSYLTLFARDHQSGLSFIVLGIIGLNFAVQMTGGGNDSPLFPLYFILTSAAAFQKRAWAYPAAGLILAIEAANLALTGHAGAGRWYSGAGFAASLAGVAAITAHISHRIRCEAKEARDSYEKLISDADAVDPLAGGANVEALDEKRRQAANVSVARGREGAFGALIDAISGLVPAHTYALFLDDRDDGVFSLRVVRSQSRSASSARAAFAKGSGLVGICAAQNRPQYHPSLAIPVSSLGYYIKDEPVRSFLAAPIEQGGRVAGVLCVDSLEHDAFPGETRETLFRFIPFFSQVIENIRISAELDIRAKNFAALHGMSSVLSSSLDTAEVLGKLTVEVGSVVPHDFCAFLAYDETNGEAQVTALKGYDGRFTGSRFPIVQSAILSNMLNQWKDRRILSIHHDPDLGDRGREIGLFPVQELQQPLKSLYGRPLVARDKFVGAAFLASLRSEAFTDYHRKFLDTLLNQVSMVVDNGMLHQRIRDMARTDGLTGLLNHRTFMEKLKEESRRLDRLPRPFSILLMDIDKFKGVNDKYGHPVGDIAIKTVAGVLRETVRVSDFAARYGGEEFAVGMVDTDLRGAQQMGERIRKVLEKTLVTRVFDGELRLTVSIGVSSFPEDTENRADLVTMADNALYQAKRSGRNRVCLHRDIDKHPGKPV